MDAVKYLKELSRMCNAYEDCEECPLFNNEHHSCIKYEHEKPEEAVAIVNEWIEKHPKKTIKSKLLEDYPNAIKYPNGNPAFCIRTLGYSIECPCNCTYCWERPLPDE